MSDTLSLDGLGPLPAHRPESAAEVGHLVRGAVAAGHGVYPFGGGAFQHVGRPPAKPGVAVDTRGLAGVDDYPARDLTVTVKAGTTAAELARVLAAEGQRLPVDLPQPDAVTVGAALAVNLSGPRRLGWGTLRDYVIGVRFVAADGAEVQGGGRVVKNVAGYDLMKLHIGAVGTLGVVTQATFKVTPKPEDEAVVVLGLPEAAVGPTLDRLHASTSRPTAVDLLDMGSLIRLNGGDPGGWRESGSWGVVVGFEGKSAAVGWQLTALRDELKSAPVRLLAEARGSDASPWWARLTPADGSLGEVVLKATVRPSRVAGFAATARAASPGGWVHAHAGNGVVHLGLSAPEGEPPLTLDRTAAVVRELSAQVGDGSLTVRRAPTDWKKALPVWGTPGGDWAVMRAVKAALDPHDVFNPGRLA